MKGILDEIIHRIITAIGLDSDSHYTLIDWETFLLIHCMCEAPQLFKQIENDTIDDDSIYKVSEVNTGFWVKFFDPKRIGIVTESDYMDLLEKLIRGSSFEESNNFTELFATNM